MCGIKIKTKKNKILEEEESNGGKE